MSSSKWMIGLLLAIALALPPAAADVSAFAPGPLGPEWAAVSVAPVPSEVYSLNLVCRATTGSPALELGSGTPPAAWWRWPIPGDGKPHRVELVLSLPAGETLLVRRSGEGAAQVEQLQLKPLAKALEYRDNVLSGVREAVIPEPLPAGWEPQGTLDARSREVGDSQELTLSVGGLDLSSPAEITVVQGVRQGMPLFIRNPGELDKSLQIAVSGPPGMAMPIYSLPIAPRGTTLFAPPLQLMRVGDAWVRYTFTVDRESGSMPLRVHVARTYPVLMQPSPPEPGAAGALPFGLTFSSLPAAVAPEQALRLPSTVFLSGRPALQDSVKQWRPPLLQVEVDHEVSSYALTRQATEVNRVYRWLREEVLPLSPDSAAVSPSWPVATSEQGLLVGEDMKAAFEGGLGQWVQSVGVSLPAPPAGGVLLEKFDGKVPPANLFWSGLSRRYDFTALRQFLATNQAQLPLLLELPSGAPAGRTGLLALARLLLEGTWQGSTGAVMPPPLPDSPEARAIAELWRELAGALPLYLPPTEDDTVKHTLDAPVTYWPFLRGKEGIVFLANNSSAPQDLALEVRGEPVQLQVLRLSAFGEPVTRWIQDLFRFSEEAQKRHQQGIYLKLAPGEIVGIALTIPGATPGWLRSVGKRTPYTPPGGIPLSVPKTDPWNVGTSF